MNMSPKIFLNPRGASSRRKQDNLLISVDEYNFHRTVLPGYTHTPLHQIQVEKTVGKVFVKDESDRFGLPAFKVLGGSFAAFIELCRVWKLDPNTTQLTDLAALAEETKLKPLFVTATDGNHGRGLAWFARQIGVPCQVFVPSSVVARSIAKIRAERASVEQLRCDYDGAVEHAKRYADDHRHVILIQDTAWEGYKRIPRAIVQGYGTLVREINEQCRPTHVICPVGVGSLASAIVHFSHPVTKIITVEPVTAACLFTSLEQDRIVPITTGDTIMPGLNCGTVSVDAWPTLRTGIAASVQVTDGQVCHAMKILQKDCNIDSGPCGAAALAALQTICEDRTTSEALGLDQDSVVVLLSTEGSRAAF